MALARGRGHRAADDRPASPARCATPSPTAGSTPALVDRAVERTLRLKFRLGLFERPYVDAADAGRARRARRRRSGALALDLARRSLVLVENDGVLPLRPDVGRIAVIGPIADSPRDLLGDYATCRTSRRCAELPRTRRTRSGSRRAT